jgi:FlaA1/EpsC-like NDP-sugar epimerase
MNYYDFIDRNSSLLQDDIEENKDTLLSLIAGASFLVIGGGGSIGQAVVKELFSRNPRVLHVVDLSENSLVELVRDIRSTKGYIDGDFSTYSIDYGSVEFDSFFKANGPYDYVLNLSALKHVRSERDPYTLMRMLKVNVADTVRLLHMLNEQGNCRKYFCVSTDKAANPVNLMGASKRVMEYGLMSLKEDLNVSSARFANVLFSCGSLPEGFTYRFNKQQPLAGPSDVERYFVTPEESGQLCLMSCLLGNDRELFFPKPQLLTPITFKEIATVFLQKHGYEPLMCDSEEEARIKVKEALTRRQWPCYFSSSDTTGEKPLEEFFQEEEIPDMNRFSGLGVLQYSLSCDIEAMNRFLEGMSLLRDKGVWSKKEIVELVQQVLPDFHHWEKQKYLDGKM